MTYTSKKLSSLFIIVLSLLLVGCTTQETVIEEQAPEIKLTLSEDESSVTNIDSDATELVKGKQQEADMQKGEKTLDDFETIEASQVTFETSKGEIVMELYRDKAPLTTANFLQLIKDGFYDGVVFHRVIDDFMVQVGDPLTKEPGNEGLWGTGGPGYTIADEFDSELTHDGPGVLSMANAGPNTGGSQIFITHVATPWLDGKHAVFGKVIQGMEVVNAIEKGDTILKAHYF